MPVPTVARVVKNASKTRGKILRTVPYAVVDVNVPSGLVVTIALDRPALRSPAELIRLRRRERSGPPGHHPSALRRCQSTRQLPARPALVPTRHASALRPSEPRCCSATINSQLDRYFAARDINVGFGPKALVCKPITAYIKPGSKDGRFARRSGKLELRMATRGST